MSSNSVVVVGGGPAGCSAALGFLRHGFAVTVLEQRARWRGRVCGAFLNPEAVGHLSGLGLLDEARAAGAAPVTHAKVFFPDGRKTTVPLTRGGRHGLALSRESLESLLVNAVRRAGGRVETGRHARVVERTPKGWRVESSMGEEFFSEILVRAGGRDSGRGPGLCPSQPRPLKRDGPSFKRWLGPGVLFRSIRPWFEATGEWRAEGSSLDANGISRKEREGWYGWNATFQGVAQRPGELTLHFYHGGYVGALTFSDGTTNVCGLVHRADGETKNWHAVFQEALEKLPSLRRAAHGAERLSDWRGVGPLPFGWRMWADGGALLAGDAAAVGDPYMGEGIARALGAGPLVAECLRIHVSAAALTADYRRLWNRRYRGRLIFGALVRGLLRRPLLFQTAAAFLSRRPEGLTALTGIFHDEGAVQHAA